jgi:uncharacterized protein (TIGR03437 family)
VVSDTSAASALISQVAPGSIATAKGPHLATAMEINSQATPPTTLGGTTVNITDFNGRVWPAPLFYASPKQVNYLVPTGVAEGSAVVTLTASDGTVSTDVLDVERQAPSLFQLNTVGLVAANVLRVSGGNSTYETVYSVTSGNGVIARPIDLGPPGDQVYLLLYGTGMQALAANNVSVTMDGISVPVSYAGPQGGFPGLDQVNVLLPRSLAGRGDVALVLTARGTPSATGLVANTVRVTIK